MAKSKQSVPIQVGDHTVYFVFEGIPERVNISSILRINPQRITAEVLTFDAILGEFGRALAEADHQVRQLEMAFEKKKAKLKDVIRTALKAKARENKWTVDDINVKQNAKLHSHPAFAKAYGELNEAKFNRDHINSVYWAAKGKADRLGKITEKLYGEDFVDLTLEKLGGATINGIKIIVKENLIK
jgi:hypothetical protein